MPKLADLFDSQPRQPPTASRALTELRERHPQLCFADMRVAFMRHDRGISGICARCGTPPPAVASSGGHAHPTG